MTDRGEEGNVPEIKEVCERNDGSDHAGIANVDDPSDTLPRCGGSGEALGEQV